MIITICQRPFSGSVCESVQQHQCGGISINDTRIGSEGGTTRTNGSNAGKPRNILHSGNFGVTKIQSGRWPANILLSKSVVEIIDKQSNVSVSGDVSRFFKVTK